MAGPLNPRPFTPIDNDLQNFFNANISGVTYNVVNDQNPAAIFAATGTPPGYDDLLVVAESITPISEPGTMLLLGAGLIFLVGLGRKKLLKR